jgi:hypothetical protein
MGKNATHIQPQFIVNDDMEARDEVISDQPAPSSNSSEASTSTATTHASLSKLGGRVAKKTRKNVRFAPGPLSEQYEDGHPPHEGQVAMPVRRLPPQYPADFTKASIKELASTDFAQSCPDSLKRLMFKVGLVQHERPDRVFATAGKPVPKALQLLQLLQSQQLHRVQQR